MIFVPMIGKAALVILILVCQGKGCMAHLMQRDLDGIRRFGKRGHWPTRAAMDRAVYL